MAASREGHREVEDNPDASMENKTEPALSPAPPAGETAKKPSKLKELWKKTGLDPPTLIVMGKAALPPTIAIAIYQSNGAADTFSTLGYLVAIASILGFCIMPRAKFFQTMLINVITICIASAVQLLAIWSSIQARLHTTPAGASPFAYNSSASAVCAVWLFFETYLVNTLKSARPQLQFPFILSSIFINVSMVYAPSFPTVAIAEAFIRRLLIAFLTGFGIATGVSLFIFPVTTRTVVFKEMTGYVGALRAVLKAQTAYMKSLQHDDMFRGQSKVVDKEQSSGSEEATTKGDSTSKPKNSKHGVSKGAAVKKPSAEAAALKGAVAGLRQLHGKLDGDLTFSKRETAWGKLNGSDISELFRLLQRVLLPVVGLSSIIDIFERVGEIKGFATGIPAAGGIESMDEDAEAREQRSVQEWQTIMKTLDNPMTQMTDIMDQGLEHVLLALEFKKPPKKKAGISIEPDVEARGDTPKPGEREFVEHFDRKSNDFYESKQVTLKEWCDMKEIPLPDDFFEPSYRRTEPVDPKYEELYHENQRQMFMVLYMEYLLWCASRALYDLIRFAEIKIASGVMKKNRLISPGWKRVKKWIKSIFKAEGATQGDRDINIENPSVLFGDSFHVRKDPEHLAPESALQWIGDVIRKIPQLLRSDDSVFGFRVACATLSLAIVAYLGPTQVFFTEQRLVWAMIMVAISMTRTAGQSLFNFLLRIGGTTVAMAMSFVIWYIVDGKTPGVIVFLWIWISCAFYVVIKLPKFAVVGIISGVTSVLIIGYELQVRKIGLKAATSSGQPFYPVYELAPYRLATVTGGLAVAYFWTIFPYPITEHSELRRELGSTLFLLANYYSAIHETVSSRVRGDEGNVNLKGSPGHQLEKIRTDIFAKEMALITRLKTYSAFEKWQMSLGGKWPKATYDAIIHRVETIVFYIALIGYASSTFGEDDSQWSRDFKQLLKTTDTTTHEVTSTLALLSSSVSAGRPLPPYLRLPEPYRLIKNLESLDTDILSIRHIAEPGYAAFAVIQISSRAIISDLIRLVAHVKELVGEMDFSYQIASTTSSPASSSNNLTTNDLGKDKEA